VPKKRYLTPFPPSNPSIVSLSADDPPILTAVAPGTAIVYVVGMPILVTVYSGTSLPVGTPIWSVPTAVGNFAPLAAPAVPSASGADLLVLDNVGLKAFATDGSPLWNFPVTRDDATQLIPDFSGSAFVTQPYTYEDSWGDHDTHTLQWFNASTQQLTTVYQFQDSLQSYNCWQYGQPCPSSGDSFSDRGAVHVAIPQPSGVVFVLDYPASTEYSYPFCYQIFGGSGRVGGCYPLVEVINPSTGQTLGATYLYNAAFIGPMIVAGDGNAYLPYAGSNAENQRHVGVLVVAPDGTTNDIDLFDRQGNLDNFCDPGFPPWECAAGLYANPAPWLSTITNGDSGAAVLAELSCTTYCSGDDVLPPETLISYVSQSGLVSQVTAGTNPTVNNWLNPITLGLQREDGSYIGADSSGNLLAIGTSGNVVWQTAMGAPVTPLYATADGGAIVTSSRMCSQNFVQNPPWPPAPCTPTLGTLYTVDQNGNVTSQMPDPGTTYSWKAAYATTGDPVLNQLPPYFDLATIATSFAASRGGNLTGNGFSLANHTFGLVFCGSAPADGPCTSLDWVNTFPSMQFSYLPQMTSQNWNSQNVIDLSQVNSDWVTTIKNQALAAFTNAFANLPAIVSQKPALDFKTLSNQSLFEHTVYVVGGWGAQGPGLTDQTIPVVRSVVFYPNEVSGAEVYLTSNPQITNTVAMQKIVQAIGIGIGNSAVHEIGWHIPVWNQACTYSGDKGCEGGDTNVYEFEAAGASNYGVGELIHWQEYNKVCKLPSFLLKTDLIQQGSYPFNGTLRPCNVTPDGITVE
jgi:hypothetical protein